MMKVRVSALTCTAKLFFLPYPYLINEQWNYCQGWKKTHPKKYALYFLKWIFPLKNYIVHIKQNRILRNNLQSMKISLIVFILIKFLIECELFPPFHIFIVFYPLPGWEYSWDWVTSQCQWWPPATSEAACCHSFSFRGWTFQLTTLLTLHLHNTIYLVLS